MKFFLIISVVLILCQFQSIAQDYRRWVNTEILSLSLAKPVLKNSGSDPFISFDFLSFSTSLGYGTPFMKFGIGASLIEGSFYGENSLMTFFPIKIHFIPWMKIRDYSFQPIDSSKVSFGGRSVTYYYDPNKTRREESASSYVDITLLSTLWGLRENGLDNNGLIKYKWGKKYFNIRASFVKYLRSNKIKRNIDGIHVDSKLCVEINNYLIIENSHIVYVPNIGIRLIFGKLEFI